MTTNNIDRWWPLIVIGIISTILGSLYLLSNQVSYDNYVHGCIEANGVPVKMMTYTKGYGDHWACVNISNKVDIK